MDEYEFDANLDRLRYGLDCARLDAFRSKTEMLRLCGAMHTSPQQIAGAQAQWQSLERRISALQSAIGELQDRQTA